MEILQVPGTSVTVQARLFEGSHVIDLAACTLTGSLSGGMAGLGRERGRHATVGIESADGRDGVQYSFNRSILVPGQAVRLTP
jgi:hypothetical protein